MLIYKKWVIDAIDDAYRGLSGSDLLQICSEEEKEILRKARNIVESKRNVTRQLFGDKKTMEYNG